MSPRPRKSTESAAGTAVKEAGPEAASTPKRRGRPPKSAKVDVAAPSGEAAPGADAVPAADAAAAKDTAGASEAAKPTTSTPKRRGRPPKSAKAAKQAADATAAVDAEREAVEAIAHTDEVRVSREPAENDDRDAEEARAEDGDPGDDRDEQDDRGPRDERVERNERGRRGRRGGSGQRRGGFNFRDLQGKILPELHLLAKEVGLEEYRAIEKDALVVAILERVAESEGLRVVQGFLEISSDGYGFLQESLLQHNTRTVIVSAGLIKQFRLRTGDLILGKARRPRDNERYGTLIRVEAVNGVDPFQAAKRPRFDDLIPTFPDRKITLETAQEDLSARVIDLLAPIGRGQRGLIVAPPKAGKTMLLKAVAKSVVTNEPDIKVMVLLVDERPEEVTDFRESVSGVEVMASTFDEPPANHIRVAEFVHERSRRIVEDGGHVMILLDSITRLARANNLVTPATGRTLSGGLDSNALHWPKRFLGAARNIRGGGSLSILATALIETGSRMDDVIFEEFKGTGNMELHLSRRLEERRIFPAIDILKSGTRREDLLLSDSILAKMWLLRKVISDMDAAEAMEMLLSRLQRTRDNAEFLSTLGQG